MTVLQQNRHASLFEPVITDFKSSSKGVKFKKELLVDELLSLGNSKITRQVARLIGDGVEREIHRKKIEFLSSELISELVACKLEELGLIRLSSVSLAMPSEDEAQHHLLPENNGELSKDVLDVLVAKEAQRKEEKKVILPQPTRLPLRIVPELVERFRNEFSLAEGGQISQETAEEIFTRVSKTVAEIDAKYAPLADAEALEVEFYNMLGAGFFLPDPAILRNVGRQADPIQSSVSLVVEDSTQYIFDALRQSAIMKSQGIAASLSFSRMRSSSNNEVAGNRGRSCGAVDAMKVFKEALQGLCALNKGSHFDRLSLAINHPDILDFMNPDNQKKLSEFFCLSIVIDDAFMKAVKEDLDYSLVDPITNLAVNQIKARKLLRHLVQGPIGDTLPTLVFIDHLKRDNVTPKQGRLEFTLASGEEPLLPNEACPHGSVNVGGLVKDGKIDWGELKRVVHLGVHFLDNVIEWGKSHGTSIGDMNWGNRKMGLGVCGWADLLMRLGIPYASEEALLLGQKTMSFIHEEAEGASIALACQRGFFPNYHESLFACRGIKRRHATLTNITNTEPVDLFFGVSQGIEPINFLPRHQGQEGNPTKGVLEFKESLRRELRRWGAYSEILVNQVVERSSMQSFAEIPEEVKRVFVTYEEIPAEWHLRMQSAFQEHTEGGVFKTIPICENPREEIAMSLLLAHQLGVKTVFLKTLKKDKSTGSPLNVTPTESHYFIPT